MDEKELLDRVAALEARVRSLEARLEPLPPPAVPPARPMPPPPVPQPQPRPAIPKRDLESTLGANWLAKAGVLVLALGVVFLLKLAFDQGWIGLRGRYALGLAGGAALFVLGDLLRRRPLHPSYPQVLAGGGAVIAYVTVYAGWAFGPLRDALDMTLPLTLVLLALVSAGLGAYAAWRDLPVLAGTAVALATLLLGPAGDVTTAGVLYATFLDAALLAAAAWRGWGPVSALSLVAADGVLLVGLAQDVPWGLALGAGVGVNALAALAAEGSRSPRRDVDLLVAALAPVGLFLVAGMALDEAGTPDPAGWGALAAGLAASAAAFPARRVRPALGVAGAALLLLWPFLHFPGRDVQPLAWLALGAAGLALAPRLLAARNALHAGVLAALAFTLLSLWSLDQQGELLAEAPVPGVLLHAGALALAGALWWLRRRDGLGPPPLRQAALAAAIAAPILLLGHLLDGWAIAVGWALLALALVVAGIALRDQELRLSAFAAFALVLARIFLVDLSRLSLVSRVVAFLLVGALLLVAAYLYARGRPGGPGGGDDPNATSRTFK